MKNTRANKNHSNNKITKIYVFIVLGLLTLGAIALTTAIYLQPAHYEGDTFTNAKTSISSTTTSSSSTNSSETVETNDSTTNTNPDYTEYDSNQVINNYSQETNNNTYNQTPMLTKDIVYSYAGWNYQEAIIDLKNNYGISGVVTQTVETHDFKDNVIISASYENNMVYFQIAKHVDTNPYLPVGPEPSQSINTETNE